MGKSHLSYNFFESSDKQDDIYTTVIIGPNGTGKSNLFRIIIELFKELNDLGKGKKRSYNVDGQFNLKYFFKGDIFEYSNIYDYRVKDVPGFTESSNHAYLLKNSELTSYSTAEIPLAIVANSIMLTDKYPFFKKETTADGEKLEAFPQYKYLGIRNIAQNASTRAYVRKTVEFINQKYKSDSFRKGLERATDFLGLAKEIDIFYFTSNNSKFFKGNLTPDSFMEYFEAINEKYSNPEDIPPFKLHHYLRIKPEREIIGRICDFCNEMFNNGRLVKPNYKYSSIRKIIYNLIEPESFKLLNEEFEMLEHLRQLGMISAPEIELKRMDGYSLQESSSGEYHFFSSIVGLMATVERDSLVFIDEPEISLHPNWQMQYMNFIRELFDHPDYRSSHILVATHSHFLISDLKPDSSKILGLKRENGKIQLVDLPDNLDTFGWSAEDILYNIFNVRSSLNYYLQADLTELLGMISNDIKDVDKIEGILNKLHELPKRNNDPLQEIIQEATEYLNSIR